MKYVNVESIENYKKIFKKENLSNEDLVHMVNWFAEGAITTVSNVIYELMEEKDCDKMVRGLTQGCRCGSCYSWKFLDENDKVIKEVDDLKDLIKKD